MLLVDLLDPLSILELLLLPQEAQVLPRILLVLLADQFGLKSVVDLLGQVELAGVELEVRLDAAVLEGATEAHDVGLSGGVPDVDFV